MASSLPAFSRYSALLMRTPCSAPKPEPTIIDVGVARPSAQGQAITSTAVALMRATLTESPTIKYHTRPVKTERPITAGTKYCATISAIR